MRNNSKNGLFLLVVDFVLLHFSSEIHLMLVEISLRMSNKIVQILAVLQHFT